MHFQVHQSLPPALRCCPGFGESELSVVTALATLPVYDAMGGARGKVAVTWADLHNQGSLGPCVCWCGHRRGVARREVSSARQITGCERVLWGVTGGLAWPDLLGLPTQRL